MKERYEIGKGKEVFKNKLYSSIPTLKNIITENQKNLDELLSIKIRESNDHIIDQYNIETKRFITNITTIQGLDLNIAQYNKETKTREIYSPYSNPGYNVFAHRLLAYFELHKKHPPINFSDIDIKGRNEASEGRENPIIEFVDNIRWEGNIFWYIYDKEKFFGTDKEWVRRIIYPTEEETGNSNREGVGIQNDTTIIQFWHEIVYNSPKPAKIIIENELIPIYLQAFIDTNRRVAWPTNATNLKKIVEMIFYVLEGEEKERDKRMQEARRKTPLISN